MELQEICEKLKLDSDLEVRMLDEDRLLVTTSYKSSVLKHLGYECRDFIISITDSHWEIEVNSYVIEFDIGIGYRFPIFINNTDLELDLSIIKKVFCTSLDAINTDIGINNPLMRGYSAVESVNYIFNQNIELETVEIINYLDTEIPSPLFDLDEISIYDEEVFDVEVIRLNVISRALERFIWSSVDLSQENYVNVLQCLYKSDKELYLLPISKERERFYHLAGISNRETLNIGSLKFSEVSLDMITCFGK